MTNNSPVDDLARSLADAWAHATAIPAPTSRYPSLTLDEAYQIQESVVATRIAAARSRAGWKLGLTTVRPPVTPIAGTLLSDMVVPSGTRLPLAGMVAPMVEAELVIRIGETSGHLLTVDEISAGRHAVGPGIEVIDYRTTNSSGPIDWVADNSTVAYAVTGGFTPVSEIDPGSVQATLCSDGRELGSGGSDLVMGNPLAAVAWLSGHLADRGLLLEKGHVVLTGSLTGHHVVPSKQPSRFTADFGPLGSVEVGFDP